MESTFRSGDFGKCIMNAVYTILFVHSNTIHQFDQLEEIATATENNFNRSGYAIELIDDLVISKWKLPIEEYIKSVLLQAINQHIFTSYSKTQIGQSLVHNYMIEEYFVWRLRETLPNRTSPRLQNVLQYIADIGWITRTGPKYSITDLGITIAGA